MHGWKWDGTGEGKVPLEGECQPSIRAAEILAAREDKFWMVGFQMSKGGALELLLLV